jgi:serine/threonine-protein kinase
MTPQRWQKINELFHAAVELCPDERTRFLEERCAGDPLLRGEVETLLASDAQAAEFIEEPAVKAAADLLSVDQHGLRPGQRAGSYEVKALIAKGGMGEVYLATDSKLGRKVALKLLPPIFTGDGERVRRFAKEARAISALNHPNIIVVYDIVFDGQMHFIVTEYVKGETLRQRMSGALPTLIEALNIVIQIGGALDAAHQAGIIHRDIKPENVMLRPDGYVKVLDFGLAKLTQPQKPGSPGWDISRAGTDTDPGRVMGTARYMSPEQARGLDVDARTDVFSLGVILYELISGRPPFDGETNSDVICELLTREPPPLADSGCPELPELERIIAKSLAKDRAGRYQLIRDFLADLQRLKLSLETGGQLLNLARMSPAKRWADKSLAARMADRTRRHKREFVLLSALAVILAAAVLYFTFTNTSFVNDRELVRDIAVLPFAMESADPDAELLADGLTESLIDSLSQSPKLRVIGRHSVFRYKNQQQDIQSISRDLNVQAVITGKIIQRGDGLTVQAELLDARNNKLLWGDQFEEKENNLLAVQNNLTKLISEKLELRLNREEQQRVMKRYTDDAQAYRLYVKGRYYWNRTTAEDVKQAIEYFNQAIAEDPNYALAYAGLAQSYSMLAANYAHPPDIIPLAKAYAQKAIELDDALDEAHYAIGLNAYLLDWNWPLAEREFKLTLELNPSRATARSSYGGLLRVMGQMDAAIAEIQRALESDPLSLRIRVNLGLSYYYNRQYEEALKQFRIALQMDPNAFIVYVNLGRCFTALGQFEASVAALNKAIELSRNDTWALVTLGQAYAAAGRQRDAERILAELLGMSDKVFVRPYEIALVYAGLGDDDRAIEWLYRAYQEHSPYLLAMKYEPLLDGLHRDERFQALLKQIGLSG